MNTLKIIQNIDQKVVDKDSFNIITQYVRMMEEYDDFVYRAKTIPNYEEVMGELRIVIYDITEDEDELMKDMCIKSVIIMNSYKKHLLEEVKTLKKYYKKFYTTDNYTDNSSDI